LKSYLMDTNPIEGWGNSMTEGGLNHEKASDHDLLMDHNRCCNH
jgi:hypothetical protein